MEEEGNKATSLSPAFINNWLQARRLRYCISVSPIELGDEGCTLLHSGGSEEAGQGVAKGRWSGELKSNELSRTIFQYNFHAVPPRSLFCVACCWVAAVASLLVHSSILGRQLTQLCMASPPVIRHYCTDTAGTRPLEWSAMQLARSCASTLIVTVRPHPI